MLCVVIPLCFVVLHLLNIANCIYGSLLKNTASFLSCSSYNIPVVAVQPLPQPLSVHILYVSYPMGCSSYGYPPRDCLLVGMQAWNPIVCSCLSALSSFPSPPLSLFLFPAPCVHSFFLYKKTPTENSINSESRGRGRLGK